MGNEKEAKETERKVAKLKIFLAVLDRTRARKVGKIGLWRRPPVKRRRSVSVQEEGGEGGETGAAAGRERRSHRPQRNPLRDYVSEYPILYTYCTLTT